MLTLQKAFTLRVIGIVDVCGTSISLLVFLFTLFKQPGACASLTWGTDGTYGKKVN